MSYAVYVKDHKTAFKVSEEKSNTTNTSVAH
jgi:hypothetical protein